PAVAVTAPSSGATVAGTISVNVTASDTGSGVASVQLVVDGTSVGQPDLSNPYTFSLDTTSLTDGSHTIGATAIDGVGNVGTAASVPVIVSNAVITPDASTPDASADAPAGDTQPPTAPTTLTATATTSSQINLSWTAATEDDGVTAD